MKVYFAHPCFSDKQIEFKRVFFKMINQAFEHMGMTNEIVIIDPFDHTPNVENDMGIKLHMSEQIMEKCLQLLDECDIVVALIDGDDTGTAFEAGYAHSIKKPVILISEDFCGKANAMLIGSAETMIDNILDENQMKELSLTIKSFHGGARDNQVS